jgi:hypothetical protein
LKKESTQARYPSEPDPEILASRPDRVSAKPIETFTSILM